jgi:hypothetical protein
MALPTTATPAATPRMAPTPGVGAARATAGAGQPPAPGAAAGTMQPPAGHVAQTPETKGAEPMLVEGIDPVLLHRLYPDADSAADVGKRAMEQGKQTHEQGAVLQAAQQAPVQVSEQ